MEKLISLTSQSFYLIGQDNSKYMKKLFLTTLFFLPFVSQAATLRFDPPVKEVNSGDVFVTNIRIDVKDGECVNAVGVSASYPTNLLRLNTLSRGESIFSLWIEEKVDHDLGQVRFTAGIPAGYCGRTAGDPGNTNIVGKIAFQYLGDAGSPDGSVSFLPETEVILNDGMGTKSELSVSNLAVKYSANNTSSNEWLDIVKKDTFPPEAFTPEIIQDISNPEKPYVLIFDTTDKQSGVEHYELVEEDPKSFGFRFGSRIKAKMSIAKSPYVLQDQTLSSRIVVRAFDHAGNFEESILPPKNLPPIFNPYSYDDYIIPGILLIICVMSVILITRHYYKKKEKTIEDIIDEEISEME